MSTLKWIGWGGFSTTKHGGESLFTRMTTHGLRKYECELQLVGLILSNFGTSAATPVQNGEDAPLEVKLGQIGYLHLELDHNWSSLNTTKTFNPDFWKSWLLVK